MKKNILLLNALIFIGAYINVLGQKNELVQIGSNGKLSYKKFANTGQTNAVNIVPDFSYAGYKGGGVSLPDVPIVEIINPMTGDARSKIQSAINRASALPLDENGFRGAVLIKSGKYEVSGPLTIKASGVVLRGEGQNTEDKGGTVLYDILKSQHDFIQIKGNESIEEESYSEKVLDTQLYPAVDTWHVFNIFDGVLQELKENKILSIHITADQNQFVSYASKENTAQRPVLELAISSSGVESIITIIPVADAYVQGGANSSINYGTNGILVAKNGGSNLEVTRESYMKFDLTSIEDSVIGASLKLFTKKDLTGEAHPIVNISISAIEDDSWEELAITFDSKPGASGSKRIITEYVPSGAISFEVGSASGLSVGDTIQVTRTPNSAWIDALDMAQYGWTASTYTVSYERIITGIEGNIITVNVPLVQAIETAYGGGEIAKVSITGRIKNSGVENMMINSFYAAEDDELHGWSAITITDASDCWVKKVTAQYFGYGCVGIYNAFNTTVEECAMLYPKSITTGERKYSFYIDKGSFNLFQRCFTRGGRHDYATGSRVAGPNSFVDCYSKQTNSDIGPHHRYATGILFDHIFGGEMRVQNRKAMGSGHGWAGAQIMFWNCDNNGYLVYEFKVESPIGAMNWGIGCSGLKQAGDGYWESWGKQVTPHSLYLKQLEDRLGTEAVDNITIPEQRNGNIWEKLSRWEGIGDLSLITDVNDEKIIPQKISLEQNYPNPFNSTTQIKYSIGETGAVVLKIYDVLGSEVSTLVNEIKSAGSYTVNFNASAFSSGIYFYKLESGSHQEIKKMTFIK